MRFAKTVATMALLALLLVPGLAWAGNPTGGNGVLGFKDLTDRTVVIDGRVYQVNVKTVMRDWEGNKLTLAMLPVPEAGTKPPLWVHHEGKYEAIETSTGLLLTELDLTDPRR